MRNLTRGPKFSLLAATVILIALAVWPIGYAKAEKIPLTDNQKEKGSLEQEDVTLKGKRSLKYKDVSFADHLTEHNSDKPLHYRKWGTDLSDDDFQYLHQSDPTDGSYESDGYGYDDDEYDHINYKRFDSDKDKLDDKLSKDMNPVMSDSKNTMETTTIEMLSFQAKNLNEGPEGTQAEKEDKLKKTSHFKPGESPVLDPNLKKKTNEQKSDDMKSSGSDKNMGNVKVAKEENGNLVSNSEKTKNSQTAPITKETSQVVLESKEKANLHDGKDTKIDDVKNDAKVAEKDVKGSEGKEEKDAAKIKDDKEIEAGLAESKATEGGKEKSLSQFIGNRASLVGVDYKDGLENTRDAVMADDEKASEEYRRNFAGLGDLRNDMAFQYDESYRSPKYLRKKDAGDIYPWRKVGSRMAGISWEPKGDFSNSMFQRDPKEPFHLDFPLADLENTDYHKNFIKSLKRFKSLDESSRILSQGDTPSPYVDNDKTQLAARVIEEEQRKRRSRLRRLKANPMPIHAVLRKRERGQKIPLYAYGNSIRARLPHDMDEYGYGYPRNLHFYDTGYKRSSGMDMFQKKLMPNNYLAESLGGGNDSPFIDDERLIRNVKNKRQDTVGVYDEDGVEDTDFDDDEGSLISDQGDALNSMKRMTQAKTSCSPDDLTAKNQYHSFGLYETPVKYNIPLALQREKNGENLMKTLIDSRYRSGDINSDNLARLLSRDSNYVVLRKVPESEQMQNSFIKESSSHPDTRRDKFKALLSELSLKNPQFYPSSVDIKRKITIVSGNENNPFKSLSDTVKGGKDVNPEKREELKDLEIRVGQLQKGEPDKTLMYKPSLSQAYRHFKDFENLADQMSPNAYSSSQQNSPVPAFSGPEQVVKSIKKEGKEVVIMNKPFNSVAFKTNLQETVMENLSPGEISTRSNEMAASSSDQSETNLGMNKNTNQIQSILPNPTVGNSNVKLDVNMPSAGNMQPINNNRQQQQPNINNWQQQQQPNINNLQQQQQPNINNWQEQQPSVSLPQDNVGSNSFSQGQSNMMPNKAQSSQIGTSNPIPSQIRSDIEQIRLPDTNQNMGDSNRKYFLCGPDVDMGSSKHEIKIIKNELSESGESKTNAVPHSGQSGTMDLQNYNKQIPSKNVPNKKIDVPGDRASPTSSLIEVNEEPIKQSPSNTGTNLLIFPQQSPANMFQTNVRPTVNYKRLTKKDSQTHELSSNLNRFIRDFQDLSQAYDGTYKEGKLPGLSLQELTGHGDRNVQKLSSLLKEIMNNKVEVSGSDARKNLKRGMLQKLKEQKSWHGGGAVSPADPQVRSGKWTSVVYDRSNQMRGPGESLFKDEFNGSSNDEEKVEKDRSKRKKREATRTGRGVNDSMKDSTKAIEVKVKSIPCPAQYQQLVPIPANGNSASNTNNPKTNTYQPANTNSMNQQKQFKSSLQLPPEKLLELLNLHDSIINDDDLLAEEMFKDNLCRRQVPFNENVPSSPFQRRLMSVNEGEDSSTSDQDERRANCIRKVFQSYLDPLVMKITEYENKSQDRAKRKARKKREIELDESMPNGFQNILMTSLGGFGNEKREVVKKDEALWEKDGARQDSNQIIENREPNEDSTLGKRETREEISKDEKKSISKEKDSTDIRIRIVDNNGNSELLGKEGSKSEYAGKIGLVKDVKSPAEDPSIHEVYLIASTDSKKRKKKKYASPRSDQTPQKQPISSHLPQVETVYNPSPGGNKAQIEKISSNDATMKMKCLAKPASSWNATASMMEDSIIRNNLRTGNINTFTFQHREEPTPYPLQSPTNSPTSNEFEIVDSKCPSRPKPFASRQVFERFSPNLRGNTEIIYKNELPQAQANMLINTKHFMRSGWREPNSANPNAYHKDYPEDESSGVDNDYTDPDEINASDGTREGYEMVEKEIPNRRNSQGGGRLHNGEQEDLNPKMIEMWNTYAKTHLSPETHQEAMMREFEDAYAKKNLGGAMNMKLVQAGEIPVRLRAENLGPNLVRNEEEEEKSIKKREQTPIQIGQRYYYTFKTEIPDEEYYALYGKSPNERQEAVPATSNQFVYPMRQKVAGTIKHDDVDGSYIVRDTAVENEALAKETMRQKRATDEVKPKVKRHSSGHLTESHYRKYHKKIGKREIEERELEEEDRRRRDAINEAIKADIMKRIQEEKKAHSLVRNLKLELVKSDIPLISPVLLPLDETRPFDMSQTFDDGKNNRQGEQVQSQNQLKAEEKLQQPPQQIPVKSSNPDVYKTFDIKRGKRKDTEENHNANKREPGGSRHTIVSRSEPTDYQNKMFFKGTSSNKVKKYSNEGFEPLTDNLRFSEKSGSNYFGGMKEDNTEVDGPYKMALAESESSINSRRADEKKSDQINQIKEPKQKLTHGFSHEAPLLTHNNPLTSPKIFNALKNSQVYDSKQELKHGNKLRNDVALLELLAEAEKLGNLKETHQLKSAQAKLQDENYSKKDQPLVNAVLLLTKRDKQDKRMSQGEYAEQLENNNYLEKHYADRLEKLLQHGGRSGMQKRSTEWAEKADRSDLSAEIVNNEPGFGRCGGESQSKICNTKKTNNFKSPFPFSQTNNINTGDECRIGNPGEDILDSILGRVESNPDFRKVIGPGLKLRGRDTYEEGARNRGCCQNDNRCAFIQQVRKLVAKFVMDIEKLAARDVKNNCKLDGRSNRFLHELLQVPYEPVDDGLQKQCDIQIDPFLRARGTGIDEEGTGKDTSTSQAMQNRREVVLKLLAEYESLSENEKKSVEVLGQYLSHELDILNRALSGFSAGGQSFETSARTSMAPSSASFEQTSAIVSESPTAGTVVTAATEISEATKSSMVNATIASTNQPSQKLFQSNMVQMPFIWSDPGSVKFLKHDELRSQPELPPLTPFTSADNPKTENLFGTTQSSDRLSSKFELPNASQTKMDNFDEDSFRNLPKMSPFDLNLEKGKELHKLGYGDAAALLSSRSHGPWRSNLDFAKTKTSDIVHKSLDLPLPDLPMTFTEVPYLRDYPEYAAPAPQIDRVKDDSSDYDLEDDEYEDDEAYQVPSERSDSG